MVDNLKDGLDRESASRQRHKLTAWLQRPLGRYLIEQEQSRLNPMLGRMFGYHLLQIGIPVREPFYTNSPITHKMLVQLEGEPDCEQASLQTRTDALPILAESVDVVILPHVLEYTQTPHRLLREVERILIGEGVLVIIGFNPWSLCGLWRCLLAWRDEPPWNGHFYRFSRIKDWLTLLDMELIHSERCFYLPPLQRAASIRKLEYLEKLGRYCWSFFGGIHIIIARKRVARPTPIKLGWRAQPGMVGSGVATPTTRSQSSSRTV